MARIRSLHPGFWTDEAYVELSPTARLLALGIWNECDDQGVFEIKPLQLKMRLLPADNVDVPQLLKSLIAAGVMKEFTVGGHTYGAVKNFQQYQRPKKPNKVHPLPEALRRYVMGKRSSSELDEDDTGSDYPPAHHEPAAGGEMQFSERSGDGELVENRSRTGSRKSLQREEGGGREGKEKTRSSPPFDAQTVEAQFESFWAAYPRKDAKQRARTLWKRELSRGAQVAEIMAGLQAFQFTADRQFIPMASTWLNGRRWQDPSNAPAAQKRCDPPVRTAAGRVLNSEDLWDVST